jgi:hypothetical protein
MKHNILHQLLLYRYRYLLGYVLFTIGLVGLLVLELGNVPQGLLQSEQQSAINSTLLSPKADTRMIDLPYHLLQKASLYVFGVTTLSIKLPSVILAVFAGAGVLLLLKRWFSHNVAIIGGLLAITSSMFLVAGRTGTSAIMLILWSTYLLLLGTLITQNARGQFFWRVSLGLVLGLSLYTPLSVYVIGAAIIAGLLHPHIRYSLRRFGAVEATCAILLFLIAVIPLGFGLWKQPQLGLELLGIPEHFPTFTEYVTRAASVFVYLGDFTSSRVSDYIRPMISMTTLLIIILGALRTLIDHHATRTYTLLIWIAVLLPVVTLQPQHISVLYVPGILLLAIGIQTLIREWYTIFPRNPYARIAGLLPLVALILGVSYLNYTRYFEGYRYSPQTSHYYSDDLTSLNKALKSDDINKEKLIVAVANKDVAFYDLLRKKNPQLVVTDATNFPAGQKGTLFASNDLGKDAGLGTPASLVVNDNAEKALRWRIYTRW